MTVQKKLKAPFPYFGGKSRIADVVWQALGDVDHYLEPFFGSGAVLLSRTDWQGKTETINDADGFVSNFWRSIQWSPDDTAKWADWPVNHADLIARKKFLLSQRESLRQKLTGNWKWHDPEVAGVWCWMVGTDIGNGLERLNQIPNLADKGKGIHAYKFGSINERFAELSNRLRRVRVVCGDWSQICGGIWQDHTWKTVGYFLDPPYGAKANRHSKLYTEESLTVADDVAKWCLERGTKENWRIVLAGYYEEHEWLLEHGWSFHRWKAKGGYGRIGSRSMANRHREALFFSPHCLTTKQTLEDRQLVIGI